MKRCCAFVFLALAAAGVARAEGSLSVMGSYWSPKGFQDTTGFGGKLLLGGKSFGLELRASYFDSLKENDGLGNNDLQVIPLEAGLVLRAGEQELVPYLGAGAGYYILNGNSSGGGQYSVDDEVGWYAIGGLEFSIGKSTAVFGEALYRSVTGTAHADNLGDVHSNVNIDLSGLVVNFGFAIKF